MAYESGHIYLVDVEPTGAALQNYTFPVGFRVCNPATNSNYEVTFDKLGNRYVEASEITNGILAIGNYVVSETGITIGVHSSGLNKWRIKGQTYVSDVSSNILIPPAQPGKFRKDSIVATTGGGFALVKGNEGSVLIEPNIYNTNFIKVLDVLVTPDGFGITGPDGVMTIGPIVTTASTITVKLHSSGKNTVRINGVEYSRTTESPAFGYTPVTGNNLKSLIIYALPTTQVFYMAEGVAGQEAVEPELPSGALFVRKIIVSHDNQYVDAESLSGFQEKAVDGWKTHFASSAAPAYLVLDNSHKCNFSVVQLSSTSEINLAGISSKVLDWLYDGLEFTITNDCATDINLVSQAAGSNQKAFVLPRSPFKVKSGQSIKLYYSASQDAIIPLLLSSDAQITFATQSEMESQTPPDTENNKAVSLFGLWKWAVKWIENWDKIFLRPNTTPPVPYRMRAGTGGNLYYAGSDSIEKKLAYETGDAVTAMVNTATTAQKTAMRTALLGTATPASPVITGVSRQILNQGKTEIIDIYGLNLTLLEPAFIWIEKSDGSKIYASQFSNRLTTVVTSVWNIPPDMPIGDYPLKISNGVAVQGISTGFFTITNSALTPYAITANSLIVKKALQPDGVTEYPLNAFGNQNLILRDNGFRIPWTALNGSSNNPTGHIAVKTDNIFPTGVLDEWQFEIEFAYLGTTASGSLVYPIMGLVKTTNSQFNRITDLEIIDPNLIYKVGVNGGGYGTQSSFINFPSITNNVATLKISYSKSKGNRVYTKIVLDFNGLFSVLYDSQVVDGSNYSFFARTAANGYANSALDINYKYFKKI
ncbi:MAG: hypothetical protein ACRC0E_07255 [Soonwooa sp.]